MNPQYGSELQAPRPPPVVLEDGETVLRYDQPKFMGYPAGVFGFFFGLVVLILLTIGSGGGGFLLGIILWIVVVLVIRNRYWKRSGYWFTNERLVIHNGSTVMLLTLSTKNVRLFIDFGSSPVFITRLILIMVHQ